MMSAVVIIYHDGAPWFGDIVHVWANTTLSWRSMVRVVAVTETCRDHARGCSGEGELSTRDRNLMAGVKYAMK
jgi:hypothetical protein